MLERYRGPPACGAQGNMQAMSHAMPCGRLYRRRARPVSGQLRQLCVRVFVWQAGRPAATAPGTGCGVPNHTLAYRPPQTAQLAVRTMIHTDINDKGRTGGVNKGRARSLGWWVSVQPHSHDAKGQPASGTTPSSLPGQARASAHERMAWHARTHALTHERAASKHKWQHASKLPYHVKH